MNQYSAETKATVSDIQHWEKLYHLFDQRPMKNADLMNCLGLYLRSSALAKILFIKGIYNKILDIPGNIV